MDAHRSLLKWYAQHKRDLPWRHTRDPYIIWLSEVILQQTRVEQGLPYFLKFTSKYPTVLELAAANDDEVMKMWQGLGYYNRAANMLKTARIIADEYHGKFPGTYDGLIGLKGIGPYTAAAIASFAYDEPKAVLDGNVYRVLARLFNVNEPVNSTGGKKTFAVLADSFLNVKEPASHNQAMMELGATVCKPAQPLCVSCVMRLHCEAYKMKTVSALPVKNKKKAPVDKFFHYLFIHHKGNTFIRQRQGKGIWKGLYEFPLIETPGEVKPAVFGTMVEAEFGLKPDLKHLVTYKHQLTHQTIYADFWELFVDNKRFKGVAGYTPVSLESLHDFAVPRLLERFINVKLQETKK